MDCSPPGSSVHEILQARIVEWVAISFSRGSSPPRNQTQVSCIAGRFFPNWAIREAQKISLSKTKKSRMTFTCTEPKDTSETWSEKCDLRGYLGLPRWHCGEGPSCWSRRHRRWGFNPWVGKIPWSRKWQISILAWENPWTEEPGGSQSMRLQRVGHNWARAREGVVQTPIAVWQLPVGRVKAVVITL